MAIKSIPRKVFGSSRASVKFTEKNDVIFSVPNFSCALRNTRKLFRGLYGTVFGSEKFSGLLRNARQEGLFARETGGPGDLWGFITELKTVDLIGYSNFLCKNLANQNDVSLNLKLTPEPPVCGA